MTDAALGVPLRGGRNITIGAENNAADVNVGVNAFSGKIDDVVLYNRALNAEEIRALAR